MPAGSGVPEQRRCVQRIGLIHAQNPCNESIPCIGKGGGGVVHCKQIVHQYCNSVDNAGGGGGNTRRIDSCTKASK